MEPADNWTYAPVLVSFVADAPAAVTAAGFLSPVPGNSYKYAPVDTSTPGILYKDGPFTNGRSAERRHIHGRIIRAAVYGRRPLSHPVRDTHQ